MNEITDTALLSLTVIAGVFERKTNPSQLRHLSGKGTGFFDETDILRSAKSLDLKAKAVNSVLERLDQTPLPAIVTDKDGNFFILAKFSPEKVLIHRPERGRPEIISTSDFKE